MIKLSKKKLIEFGRNNKAYYFTGNVYNYENIILYISNYIGTKKDNEKTELDNMKNKIIKETNKKYINNVNTLLDNVDKTSYDSYKIEKMFYSCGLYGNTGQLHKIELIKDGEVIKLYYLYY